VNFGILAGPALGVDFSWCWEGTLTYYLTAKKVDKKKDDEEFEEFVAEDSIPVISL